MTPRQADKAIERGQPVRVSLPQDGTLTITITSRDRRMVRGSYEHDGRTLPFTYERSDLQITP